MNYDPLTTLEMVFIASVFFFRWGELLQILDYFNVQEPKIRNARFAKIDENDTQDNGADSSKKR